MAILEVSNLKKIYNTRFGGNQVQALKNINFSVEEGEYAVSYTHLDVYKRQLLFRALRSSL